MRAMREAIDASRFEGWVRTFSEARARGVS
jgi:hypothetical protein